VSEILAQIERAANDPQQLRAIATALDKANAGLARELLATKLELARLRGEELVTLELELRFRTEQLAARERVLFAPSSERRRKDEGDRPCEPRRERGHGPTAQPSLPMTERVHTLDEPDQSCTACGGRLEAWPGQFEESEEVDVVARSFRLVVHRRQKYRCRCGGCVETAPGPVRLVPGGRYSTAFAVDVAIAKYADHLPLARQVGQMRRAGLEVSTQTLWDQLVALEARLEPSYEALVAELLTAPVIGADETRWRLLGKGSQTWWAWSLWTGEAVVYRILASRSTQAARDLLGEYAGVVLCDGYSAYSALAKGTGPPPAREGPLIALAHCWAHVRRKFVEAEPHYPEAAEMLERIGRLYARVGRKGGGIGARRPVMARPSGEWVRGATHPGPRPTPTRRTRSSRSCAAGGSCDDRATARRPDSGRARPHVTAIREVRPIAVDVVADAAEPRLLVGRERADVERADRLLHLLAVRRAAQDHVDGRMRKCEAIAIARGRRRFAGRHLGRVEQVPTTCCGVGNEAGPVLRGPVREHVLLCAAVDGVVAEHEGVERAAPRLELAKVPLEGGAVVRAEHQVPHLPLRAQAQRRLHDPAARRLVPHAEQQEVEVLDTRAAQRDLDREPQQRGHARVRLHGEHDAVAVAPRHVPQRAPERRPADRAPVEIVDALFDDLFDEALVADGARADPEPADAQARAAELDGLTEVLHRETSEGAGRDGAASRYRDARSESNSETPW